METFTTQPGFCPICGSIFPPLRPKEDVTCYNCKKIFSANVLGDQEVEYTIHFNTYDPKKVHNKSESNSQQESEGPIVERKCSKCGYNKMSYATLQLRSADEGQTVFFTCLKCKYKESENS